MCDSPVLRLAYSRIHSPSRRLQSDVNCRKSQTPSDLLNELHDVDSSLEASSFSEGSKKSGLCIRSNRSYTNRMQLEQDVQSLQHRLEEEMAIRSILENAIEQNAFTSANASCLPSQSSLILAVQAQDLLSTISVLELTVSKLEQQIISLHFQLSQERNERRLAEYNLRHSSYQSISTSFSEVTTATIPSSMRRQERSDSELCHLEEAASCSGEMPESTTEMTCTVSMMKVEQKSPALLHEMTASPKMGRQYEDSVEVKKLPRGMPPDGLWDHPNQLSEEMVRCMKNIFIFLADSAVPSKSSVSEGQASPVSLRGHLSRSSWWSSSDRSMISSWVHSPQANVQINADVLAVENVFDPYRVRGKLSWADIGNYGLATEVSWMAVGKKQLEYASGSLRRFRILVELLAKVNPIHLSSNEKLAFWINLYNALIMHAYLAYGVPKSDLKFFSLMQKAAYTVGGHSFSAVAIEYAILKMKPPLHWPQIALLLALRKLKVSEEQWKSAINTYEPLVAFALSSGMYSSPAVRIYTAKNVKEELQEAQHDFIRASVGVSNKGKLLVPKMLQCFAKGYVDDSDLALWMLHYLPLNQAAFVEHCISQRRQSLPSSRNYGILPFDSRFRYLFLPDQSSL